MAFGGSGFTFGSTANQQQQQQQPPATTFSFGTPAAQPAATGFGATPFGQPQQPQQQSTGLFGNTANTGSTFGGTTFASTANASTSGFGASTPAFGGTANQGGGGLFGQAKPAAFTFGAPAATQPAIGGGGLFGQSAQPATGFGASATNNADPNDFVNPNVSCPIPQNGTADLPAMPNDPTRPKMWKDARNQTSADTKLKGENLLFDNIVALPMYWHISPEELRAQDYQQNRKTAPAAQSTGLFGAASTSFGAPAAQTQSGFGGSGGLTFGQQAPAAQPSTSGSLFGGFGAKPAASSPFGGGLGTATSTPFGQPAASTSTFGSTAAAPSAFGGFGQTNNQQAQPLKFGATIGTTTTTAPAQSTFGGFGQATNQTQPAPAFSFGSAANTQNTANAFGSTAAKPAFGFGTNPATDNKPAFGGFGAANTATTQPASTSLFGQPQQQQQQPTTGLFGAGGTSAFGNNNATAKPLFGAGSTTAPTAPSLFGNLGQTQQQQNQPAAPFSFGNNATVAPAAPSFSFGGATQAQQAAPAQTSLFGNTQPGLFGNLGQTQAPASNLFGGSLGSTLSLGQQNQMQQSQQSQQQQNLQPIQASIDINPYGNNPIFANIQPVTTSGLQQAPPAPSLSDSSKKQPPFVALSYRSTPKSAARITKLRGFTTSTSSPSLSASRFTTPGTPINASTRSASPSLSHNMVSTPEPQHFHLSPQAFATRTSVKKLVIDSKNRSESRSATPAAAKIEGSSTSVNSTPANGLHFNPNAEVSERSTSQNRLPAPPAAAASAPSAEVSAAARTNGKPRNDAPQSAERLHERALSEGDYYTKPTIKALQSMPSRELSDVINLEVGRKGFGSVVWQDPADLAGLTSVRELLGGVVVIEDREVMVYPGKYEDQKPEVGQGLNVPATVTLYGCWPLDKATREPIKDPQHARTKQLINKLRKKPETTFVDYVAETGAWIFNVAHFSRYGLDESDSDDQESIEEETAPVSSPALLRKKAVQDRRDRAAISMKRAASPVSDTSLSDIDDAPPQATLDESMSDAEEASSDISGEETARDEETEEPEPSRRRRSVIVPTPRIPRGAQFDSFPVGRLSRQSSMAQSLRSNSEMPQQKPLAQRLGLDPKRVAVMQASFFGRGRDASSVEAPAPSPTRRAVSPVAPPARFERALAIPAPPKPREESPITPEDRPLRQWKKVPKHKSCAEDREGQLADAGLMFGRCFRASFGPQGQLIHLGHLQRLSEDALVSSLTTVHIERPALLPEIDSDSVEAATRLLLVQLEHTHFNIEAGSLPSASTMPDLRFHHFASRFNKTDPSPEAGMWRLGQALFDEIELRIPAGATAQLQDRIYNLRRREAFSEWLRGATAAALENDLRQISDDSIAQRVFTLMTGNQVDRACEAAVQGGDIRLATLLMQAGDDEEYQADLQLQLQKWREHRADAQISKSYRRLYELLSGNVTESKGIQASSEADTSSTVVISEGLDWKRALAIRFWYGQTQRTISTTLRSYSHDCQEDPMLSRPLPQHELQAESQRWLLQDTGRVQDAQYELIKLFCDASNTLENALAPRAFSTSPFDYRQSWHLYRILTHSLGVRQFDDTDEGGYSCAGEELLLNYAHQVEYLGLWEWSVYLLLHLGTAESREKSVTETLARHGDALSGDKRQFLREAIHIPDAYLDEAANTFSAGASHDEQGGDEQEM